MDCHPPSARRTLKKVMASGHPYSFTLQRGDSKKMVFQGHWKKEGGAGGLVEIYFDLPRMCQTSRGIEPRNHEVYIPDKFGLTQLTINTVKHE